jgi:hypothetical protein
MTRSRSVLAVAVGAAAMALAAPAYLVGATRAATFTDTSGDSGTGADVTTVAVSDDPAGSLRFTIEVPNRPAPPTDATFVLSFDSDRNDGTGNPVTAGDDYLLIVFTSRQTYAVARWSGSTFTGLNPPPPAMITYTTGALVVIVNKSAIGVTSGFEFSVIVFHGDVSSPTALDRAPDAGSWSYTLPTAQPPPKEEPIVSAVEIVKTPAKPRAGRTFTIGAALRLSDGSRAAPDRIECTARLGGKAHRTRTPGRVRCAVDLPRTARGRVLVVQLNVHYADLIHKRSVRARVT